MVVSLFDLENMGSNLLDFVMSMKMFDYNSQEV